MYQYTVNVDEQDFFYCEQELLLYLSKERRRKIQQYLQEKTKKQSIFAELLLRYVLKKHYQLSAEQIQFTYSKYGKPHLAKNSNIHFSLSHSGSWVVCAVGNMPIGVDIEEIKHRSILLDPGIYSPGEIRRLEKLPQQERIDKGIWIWTLKESYIKNIGAGLHFPLRSIQFIKQDSIIRLCLDQRLKFGYQFQSLKFAGNYYLTSCIKDQGYFMKYTFTKTVSLAQILKEI